MHRLPSSHASTTTEHGRARTGMPGALLAAALAVGCAASDGQPVPLQPLPAPVSAPHGGSSVSADRSLNAAIGAAVADAARRTGLPVASLSVISAERVTWADGSLGCPQAGAAYTMALVPGHRIRIRAQRQTLDFHSDARGHQVLCPAGRAIEPIPEARR